ncbi:hypothetical protein BD413DRAFT_227858 [Trametes elegans]|nr:hypothetical protein BD413DRAFT_227858 [Trametes elegans]
MPAPPWTSGSGSPPTPPIPQACASLSLRTSSGNGNGTRTSHHLTPPRTHDNDPHTRTRPITCLLSGGPRRLFVNYALPVLRLRPARCPSPPPSSPSSFELTWRSTRQPTPAGGRGTRGRVRRERWQRPPVVAIVAGHLRRRRLSGQTVLGQAFCTIALSFLLFLSDSRHYLPTYLPTTSVTTLRSISWCVLPFVRRFGRISRLAYS